MNLRHVRYFVAAAEELSFTRAAARCHIEQAPLSRAVKTLEQEMGVALLLRSTRSVELTPAGRLFLSSARVALEELDLGVRRAKRAQEGVIGQLTIAHLGSTAYEILPGIIRIFKTSYPLVDLRIRQLVSREQLPLIIAGEIDVGFVRAEPQHDQITALQLFSEPFLCAIPEGHPLANNDHLVLSSLAESAFVMMMQSPAPSLHHQVLSICAKAGFTPRIAQEVEQVESIVGLVSSGIGVALVPASLRRLFIPSVRYVPLADVDDKAEVWLAWPRTSASPITEAFVQCARDILSGAAPRHWSVPAPTPGAPPAGDQTVPGSGGPFR